MRLQSNYVLRGTLYEITKKWTFLLLRPFVELIRERYLMARARYMKHSVNYENASKAESEKV